MAEEWQARRPRRVYRARPLVWFGPLLVSAFYLTCGFSSDIPGRERLLILVGPAVPGTTLLLISLRARTVIAADGLRIYQPFQKPLTSRYVPWTTVEKVAIRPHGWPKRELVMVTASGRDVVVAGPAGGSRYGRELLEDIDAAWHAATHLSGSKGDE